MRIGQFRKLSPTAATVAAMIVAGCSDVGGWRDASARVGETPNYETSSIPVRANARLTPMETGVAAWDGDLTSQGMTAAHPTLPLNSRVRVSNVRTGQSTWVYVTRRLSIANGRSIELSRDAAAAVGALQNGVATVAIETEEDLRAPGVGRTAEARGAFPASAFEPAYPYETVTTAPISPPRAPVAQTTRQTYGVSAAPVQVDGYNPDIATGSIPGAGQTVSLQPRRSAPSISQSIAGASYLQFGSFRDVANAHRLVDRLDAEGMSSGLYGGAFVESATVNGQLYHRVRVGPMGDDTTVRRALRDATALGHTGAQIVRP